MATSIGPELSSILNDYFRANGGVGSVADTKLRDTIKAIPLHTTRIA